MHVEENTIDLKELISVLFRNIILIMAITILVTLVAIVFTKYGIDKKYESNTLVAVVTSDENGTPIKSEDFRVAVELAKRYSVIAKSNKVVDEVITNLQVNHGIEISRGALKDSFTVNAVNDTDILRLTVEYTNADAASKIANELTKQTNLVYQDTYESQSTNIIDDAIVNPNAVSPNIMLNTIIGFVLGGMISVGIVLVREFFNRKVKTPKDIESLGIPYLGSIRDLSKYKK